MHSSFKPYNPQSLMKSSVDRVFRAARIWSNDELGKIASFYKGLVINVSAGEDIDKQGKTYEQYFTEAESYWLSNYSPGAFRGYAGRENELLIDLTAPLPKEHQRSFDVALNHTTLEHIFEVKTAFHNLCELSSDTVILIVPFCQVQHENVGYQDFWRFTPTCLRRMFADEGMEVIYESADNQFNTSVYLFVVASRNPERWREKMPSWKPLEKVASWVGRDIVSYRDLIKLLKRRITHHFTR